nr:probable receptor-like serine/threonine-protein kinase At4g34500 [Ipomoea batatas]
MVVSGDNQSSTGFFSSKTPILGLPLYVVIAATVAIMVTVFFLIFLFLRLNRPSRRREVLVEQGSRLLPLVKKEISEIGTRDRGQIGRTDAFADKVKETKGLRVDAQKVSAIESEEIKGSSGSGSSTSRSESSSALSSSTDGSNIGWGRWYSLRELEMATNRFSTDNVIGEGGYGVVYRGVLPDGSVVAVKSLLNNKGQAEKEFKVEVEAIGKVRHKNLVGLLGYCAEGTQRLLVYEYVDNGNLEQWLHGDVGPVSPLTWDIRMKIAIGIARGYVSPDYASTGMLNEGSDVYSFGVLLMEIVTGRSPVDYSRPPGKMNLIDWFKGMVANRQAEELVDPLIEVHPPPRALKRVLLVCLRCIDMDANKRPKMGQIVTMLEADEFPFRSEHRSSRETAPLHPRASGNKRDQLTLKNAVADDEEQKSGNR